MEAWCEWRSGDWRRRRWSPDIKAIWKQNQTKNFELEVKTCWKILKPLFSGTPNRTPKPQNNNNVISLYLINIRVLNLLLLERILLWVVSTWAFSGLCWAYLSPLLFTRRSLFAAPFFFLQLLSYVIPLLPLWIYNIIWLFSLHLLPSKPRPKPLFIFSFSFVLRLFVESFSSITIKAL